MSTQPRNSEVVLVLDADTDIGCNTARRLLQMGCRVAVTARHAAPLIRIMHGYSASQIIAIAADTSDAAQLHHLIDRVERRFGHAVDRIVSTDDDGHGLALAS
jgi:NADP-dependent 3-hydroxy acid dehydrogenase YdfG